MDQPNITIHTQHRRIEALEKNQRENKIACDICCDKLAQTIIAVNEKFRSWDRLFSSYNRAQLEHWDNLQDLRKTMEQRYHASPLIIERLRTAQLKGDRDLKAEINAIRKTVHALKGGGKTKKRRKRRKIHKKNKRKTRRANRIEANRV